jgi:hypothetical protein
MDHASAGVSFGSPFIQSSRNNRGERRDRGFGRIVGRRR